MRKKLFKFLVRIDSSQAAIVLFGEVIIGALLSAFSFIVFLDIGKNVLENDFIRFDTTISSFFYSLRTPLLTKIMLFISFLGGDFLVFLASSIIVFLLLNKYKRESILFFIIFGMGALINLILKILIGRSRPDISPLIQLSTYSFPSGHSMNSFMLYGALAYFIFHFTRNRKLAIIVSIISIMLVFLISISRIYLGVHYPSDVLAGLIGGFWWLVTVILIEKTLIFYKFIKQK